MTLPHFPARSEKWGCDRGNVFILRWLLDIPACSRALQSLYDRAIVLRTVFAAWCLIKVIWGNHLYCGLASRILTLAVSVAQATVTNRGVDPPSGTKAAARVVARHQRHGKSQDVSPAFGSRYNHGHLDVDPACLRINKTWVYIFISQATFIVCASLFHGARSFVACV